MQIILYDASASAKAKTLKKKEFVSRIFKKLLKDRRRELKIILRLSGLNLIIAAGLILLVSFGPIAAQELSYRASKIFTLPKRISPSSNLPSAVENSNKSKIVQEAAGYGVDTDFSLVIPKINAATKVIPNINPADEKEYKAALKTGVAHAAGTGFPGSNKLIYLFAHSASTPSDIAEYNAVFYLLKELQDNDEIIIFFAGQKFRYLVTEKFVTEPNDTQWLTNNQNREILVLQTCWPPGTIRKRLIVTAKPAS